MKSKNFTSTRWSIALNYLVFCVEKIYFVLPIFLVLLLNYFFTFSLVMDEGEVEQINSLTINVVISVLVAFLFAFILLVALRNARKVGKINLDPKLVPVSIIIPVYNEEGNIFQVLTSVVNSNYPLALLEIIVINDGSTDASALEIEKVIHSVEADFKFLNFENNRGKKEVLIDGFRIAKHDVVLTLDSDTFLGPDSIKNLVRGFDDDVSAVCGFAGVHNDSDGFITKVQKYEYLISHQLFKSFEAYYNGVLCCPGCFSAYRKKDLMEVIDDFERSKIFRFTVDYGEDRYLTALFLKAGKNIKYVSEATASTIVPNNIRSFIVQRKRWIKSWFLSSLFLFRTVIKKPILFQLYFFLSFIFNVLIISAPGIMIYFVFTHQFYFLLHCTYIIVLYVIFSLFFEKRLKVWMPVLFYIFTILIYFWLVPLAIANVSDKRWGKRAH